MTILTANDLGKSFGARSVLKSVSFSVGDGEILCVVGRNGEGKTTLLRILSGELEPDQGDYQIVGKRSFGYLPQDPPVLSGTVLDEMLSSRRDILDLERKMKALELEMAASNGTPDILEDYSRATARFESLGGYALESKAKAILAGLGFSQGDFDKTPDVLSGGERIRLALAKLLLREPDLLLMDEPTNHLDLAGIEWLEGFLSNYRGAAVVVSHDRYFIDRVADKVLELEDGEGKVCAGNYSAYVAQKEMERRTQEEAYRRQQELIARTKAFIQKWKATPTRKNQAWSRQKMLDRLELVEAPKRERRAMGIRFDLAQESGNEVLLLEDIKRAVPEAESGDGAAEERVLFRDFTWMVRKGDRVALIGPNGCGKTTLLKCILGEDDGFSGCVRFGQNVLTGYFSQGLDDLDDNASVLEEIKALGLANQEARDLLGRFLFSGEEAEKRVGLLSGGERSRLAMAKLVVGKANLLLLDEPTNHLDMASREALEGALRDFPGTIVFASHDRYFIDRLATHLWLFIEGRIRVFRGTYSEYRQKVESGEEVPFEDDVPSFALLVKGKGDRTQAAAQNRSRTPAERSGRPKEGGSGAGLTSKAGPTQPSRPSSRELERELQMVETQIVALETKKEGLISAMNDPGLYAGNALERLAEIRREYVETEKALESLYRRWDELASASAGSGAPGSERKAR